MKKYFLLILIAFITLSYSGIAQTKYFNTFTLIVDGEGIDVDDDIKLVITKNTLSLFSNNFNFENAYSTGVNELYNDSNKGEMIVKQYNTTYYEIVFIRYIEYPKEVYLKIVELVEDYNNYLIHLHNH